MLVTPEALKNTLITTPVPAVAVIVYGVPAGW